LGQIKARLLAVNFAHDELNPVELSGLERTIKPGPKSRGHQTLRVAEVWQGLCPAPAVS